ncbi:hypothetical protein lpari_00870 [Legionella parisiensis]|uniref:Uncharacterized protein n=1 Tax=Legionella parisiensis TaxID=45071 RepID=A0A1E5JUE2_9GAMM|nr:hypothetical protein lpari_00870 [Legionella parisiensis]
MEVDVCVGLTTSIFAADSVGNGFNDCASCVDKGEPGVFSSSFFSSEKGTGGAGGATVTTPGCSKISLGG